jgi:molybdate transport system substrate-binding protein
VLKVFLFCLLLPWQLHAQGRLLVFAGAASKPPTEEIARLFEQKTGIHVEIVFGGSGFVLAQMRLSRQGDVYFPGSSDFMEIAKKQAAVFPETERQVVFLVPSINVQKGNPKGIRELKDLLAPGIRVAIGNPETVCVGLYGVELIERQFNAPEKRAFRKNILNYTESCEKTATALSLKTVDAVLGWTVFQYWDPARIETIALKPAQIIRVGYIPIAVSTFTKNRAAAQRFLDFVLSPEGKAVFGKYHYFGTPGEAFKSIGQSRPVGGLYELPADWIQGR